MSIQRYNIRGDDWLLVKDVRGDCVHFADHAALLAAKDEEIGRLRKVLEDISTPREQSFFIIDKGDRVCCGEWSAVQWRMDAARQALKESTRA